MTELSRSEIEEFWDSWLAINRKAEKIRDWRIVADHYALDGTYGWMYSPDEHFMAIGRDQIRDWAVGLEMAGLDGWHYDYQAAVIDERNAMIVGFWKQRAGSSTTRPARNTRSSASAARGSASSGRPRAPTQGS